MDIHQNASPLSNKYQLMMIGNAIFVPCYQHSFLVTCSDKYSCLQPQELVSLVCFVSFLIANVAVVL